MAFTTTTTYGSDAAAAAANMRLMPVPKALPAN